MIELNIIGVTHVSDLYPNVKYKIPLIASLKDVSVSTTIHNLDSTGHFSNLSNKNLLKKAFLAGKFCWQTLSVFIRSMFNKAPNIYICYPGVFLALLYSFVPRSRRPVIFFDAFISLYDTAINDRKLYSPTSLPARILYRLEARAFEVADKIITDTEENAAFYASLFAQSKDKFNAIQLCIPPLEHPPRERSANSSFSCLFIGSLVPLHGIGLILETIALLSDQSQIRFKIIGDGQDGKQVEEFLNRQHLPQLSWDRGFYPTAYLQEEIAKADLCLGIFGESEKAGRVIPYKIYYYAAMSKAFITRSTPCFERINKTLSEPLMLVSGQDPEELAKLIVQLAKEPKLIEQQTRLSREFHMKHLSQTAISEKLGSLFSTFGKPRQT